MKRSLINFFLSILFSLTFIFVIFSLTVLNKNFVFMVLKNNNYYEEVTNKLSYLNIEEKRVEKDIKKYVKSRYSSEYIKIPGGIEEYRDQYNSAIKFDDYFKDINVRLIIDAIYVVTITLIVITGTLFNKTKHLHDLKKIALVNLIFSIFVFGVIKVFFNIDSSIIYEIISLFNHYYLAAAIIIYDIFLIIKIKAKFM